MKKNPRRIFRPGIGQSPPVLAGREAEQTLIDDAIENLLDEEDDGNEDGEQPIMLFGPRGIGKTALLRNMRKRWRKRAHMVRITPSRLPPQAGIGALCGLLSRDKKLREKFRVEEATLGPQALAQVRLSTIRASEENEAIAKIGKECEEKPKVLMIDEAHELARDPETASRLLNLCMDLTAEARFLLILAGTADLPIKSKRFRSTFMRRAMRIPMRRLDDKASQQALATPLRRKGVGIEEKTMQKVIENSQGYPYFLQLWGKAFWDIARRGGLREISDRELHDASHMVLGARGMIYGDYYNDMTDPVDQRAALAIIRAVSEGRGPATKKRILAAAASAIREPMTEDEKTIAANDIIERLSAYDVIWEPRPNQFEPAIPSFHAYIQERENEPENAKWTESIQPLAPLEPEGADAEDAGPPPADGDRMRRGEDP